LSWGIVLAPFVALLVWFALERTSLGFALRVTGYNPRAARYAGVTPAWAILVALSLSGAIAGFAGSVQVLGVDHRLYDSFGTGAGFTGIVVALMARNNPFAVLPVAVLFGALASGGNVMQLSAGVPFHLVDVIQGLIIFFIASEGLLRFVRGPQTRPVPAPAPT
jgi:general nucleoside transport system permease protein